LVTVGSDQAHGVIREMDRKRGGAAIRNTSFAGESA
jgi:hypothetical protein